MLDVCYMFEQHITCFKPFVQGRLKGVMLYGYMFLRHLPPREAFAAAAMLLAAFIVWGVLGSVSDKAYNICHTDITKEVIFRINNIFN